MSLTAEQMAMYRAGRAYEHDGGVGVKSILTGHVHKVLLDAAQWMADYEAKLGRQTGHAGWSKRSAELAKLLPGYSFHEITAESWEWEKELPEAALSMFKSWEHSPGHWSVCNGLCSWHGYAMAQGKKKWLGCGITARKQ